MILHLRRCFQPCCFLKYLVILEEKSLVLFKKSVNLAGWSEVGCCLLRYLVCIFLLENYCDVLSISSQKVNRFHIFPHLSVGTKETRDGGP